MLFAYNEKYKTVITALESISGNMSIEFVKSRLLDAVLRCRDTEKQENENSNKAFYSIEILNATAEVVIFFCDSHESSSRSEPLSRGQYREKNGGRGSKRETRRHFISDESNQGDISFHIRVFKCRTVKDEKLWLTSEFYFL